MPSAPPVQPPPAAAPPRLAGVGIAYSTDQGERCASLDAADLPPGTRVKLVIVAPARYKLNESTLAGPCAAAPFASVGHAYALAGAPTAPFVGFALLGQPVIKVSGDQLTADLDRDGVGETFRQCTSHEGVHLTVWSGDRRRWHGYHYLGYDTEPSCSDAESAGE